MFFSSPFSLSREAVWKIPRGYKVWREGRQGTENLFALKVFTISNPHWNTHDRALWNIYIYIYITFRIVFLTCWIIGLWVVQGRCIAAVLCRGSGNGLRDLLKRHRRGAGLQGVRDLCRKPLEYGKGNPLVWEGCGRFVPWNHPKRTLPCSGRDWSPI